jgi:four helix bundle protein
MERINNLYDKSLELAKLIVILCRQLTEKKLEQELIKHLLRSGTSIGANISEAQGSISEPDYISKIHVAYKELLETKYWIDLLTKTGDLSEENIEVIVTLINEVSKILYTIQKNIRSKTIIK